MVQNHSHCECKCFVIVENLTGFLSRCTTEFLREKSFKFVPRKKKRGKTKENGKREKEGYLTGPSLSQDILTVGNTPGKIILYCTTSIVKTK